MGVPFTVAATALLDALAVADADDPAAGDAEFWLLQAVSTKASVNAETVERVNRRKWAFMRNPWKREWSDGLEGKRGKGEE